MSEHGYLMLMLQEDGDVIVRVWEKDTAKAKTASVEFCTPGSGGGGSSRTHAALIELMRAMALDNLDVTQMGRRPDDISMPHQAEIAKLYEPSKVENESFKRALTDLLNVHSLENGSDTPDMILAEFLADVLGSYDKAQKSRQAFVSEQL